jgi:hypothetical protein
MIYFLCFMLFMSFFLKTSGWSDHLLHAIIIVSLISSIMFLHLIKIGYLT